MGPTRHGDVQDDDLLMQTFVVLQAVQQGMGTCPGRAERKTAVPDTVGMCFAFDQGHEDLERQVVSGQALDEQGAATPPGADRQEDRVRQ